MTELEEKLLRQLPAEQAITFRDFMQAALYDEEFGYYNRARLPIGATGDYYTSSNVHPVFGALLAQAFVGLWRQLEDGDEEPFTLLEMGAGTGQLAHDILTALRDEHAAMFARVRYLILEQSPVMRMRQQEKLREFLACISWREIGDLELEPVIGIAFANELVDAMPVHRLRFQQGEIEELFVVRTAAKATGENSRLALSWRAPSKPELRHYIDRAGIRFVDQQSIEINLDAIAWLQRLSRAMRRGFLVTIDYGDAAEHLYAPDRRDGTLRCFTRHTVNDALLERVGEQDITASVNFSALIDYGRDAGFELVSYERQTQFLFRLGLIERLAAMASSGTVDDLKDRLAIKNLLAPGGISDNFRVLIQKKMQATK